MLSKKGAQGVLLFIAFSLVFISGYFVSNYVEASTAYKIDLTKFWEVSSILEKNYPFKDKVPDSSKQIDGAISGLVRSYGDPYTTYMSKSQLISLKDSVRGSFSGIGVEIGMKDGFLTVISPIKGSPAEIAGFLPGDIIYKVDGKDVSAMELDDIIQLIRGEKGTSVTIEVLRKTSPKPVELKPIRDTIAIPTTKSETIDNVEVISLYTFTRESVEQIYNMFVQAQRAGRSGVILDLRSNPGGLLDSSVEIASMVLPKNAVIVREKPSTSGIKDEDVFRSSGYNVLKSTMPLVVLLDQSSASASEILAGALQDHKRATIIGGQSFGKGSVQELYDLSDGSGIKLTVAKWYTPNGTSISEKGITPTILVEDTDYTDDVDDVLNRAIEFITVGK